MSAFETFDDMRKPIPEEEWASLYLRVVHDPRFAVFGLSLRDILDVSFHLKCWKKTAQDLKQDVPK